MKKIVLLAFIASLYAGDDLLNKICKKEVEYKGVDFTYICAAESLYVLQFWGIGAYTSVGLNKKCKCEGNKIILQDE